MLAIEQNYAVGWNAAPGMMIHNAAKVKGQVFGAAYGYLMNSGNATMQRFAATMLDQMNFTAGKVTNFQKQLGNASVKTSNDGRPDIDYIHAKYADDIYAKHLARPFMSQEELNEFILDGLLDKAPEFKDLLTRDIEKNFDMRL